MGEIQHLLEAALSLWSIVVQLGIVCVLTVLFIAAWIATRRKVLLTWLMAWVFDTTALAIVLVISLLGEKLTMTVMFSLYVAYSTSKVLFGLLLALGLFRYRRVPLSMGSSLPGWIAVVAGAWALGAGVMCRDLVQVQTVTYGAVAMALILSGVLAVRQEDLRGGRIAGFVFFVHGMLFVHHFVVLTPAFLDMPVPAYMSRISFVDAVSEFLVGLGCILALGLRSVDEAEDANLRLEASERALRDLVDADPLTGLFNRRRLRPFVEAVTEGGLVLFIDVDQFKAINDSWGHATGDACLRRVADVLRQVVRTSDGLFRMGGDEFLVVAPGLGLEDARRRVQLLRATLARPDDRGVALSVSIGMAPFDDETRLDQAMAAADAAMYRDKGSLG